MRKNKGITLVALVVTIVVLLILAAVSINLVLGQNGLIANAKEAREKSKNATDDENYLVNGAIPSYIAEQVNGTTGGNGGGQGGGTGSNTLPTTSTTKPYKPKSDFTVVSGTNLDNGLVIQDADGNQYVWVEVPMTTTVYPTAGLNITNFNDDAYTKIENDLHTYTDTYRNGTDYVDEYYADSTNGWFSNANEYNAQKQKMLKSIYQNGGFWVARYEAGLNLVTISGETSGTGSSSGTGSNSDVSGTGTGSQEIKVPQSKPNLAPYTSVTRTQAKKLAEMVQYTENGTTYTGSLMFGVQWDLVLAFMHNKGNVSDADLNSDSTSIGNYYNNQWNITNTLAKYSLDYGKTFQSCPYQKTANASVLLTTGASETFNKMNIYDIAGNVSEWTLEKASFSYYPCASRGGDCNDNGSSIPASYRYDNNTAYSSYSYRLPSFTLLGKSGR